ncbi:MAG: GTPase ObgE [Candidatus Levybacteria bacterium]|nr:GTPase ObgE [Candidatus Levybacteria bacterium]
MLVDNIKLVVKAGNGGDGAATFLRNEGKAKGGPDGGNGGNGGSVYFQGSTNVNDLREFRYKKRIEADDGIPGKHKKLFGKNAQDLTILLPLGTRVTDTTSGKVVEIIDTTTPILIAKGGKGGRGNTEFKSATNQSPRYAEKGTPGEEKKLFLELRIIADVGLIGLPNAGKSSLLSVLTNANPKIGNYPFTTLEPNIGMMNSHAIADIPGLIEGASKGKGLGVEFLKHIEKTKVLVHCIDSCAEDVQKVYSTVRKEFEQYNTSLLDKPEIILFTKTDLADEEIIKNNLKILKKKGDKVLACSIYNQESLNSLKQALDNMLQ